MTRASGIFFLSLVMTGCSAAPEPPTLPSFLQATKPLILSPEQQKARADQQPRVPVPDVAPVQPVTISSLEQSSSSGNSARQNANDILLKGGRATQDVVLTEPGFEMRAVLDNGEPLPTAPIPEPFGAISADPVTLIRELARQRGFSVSADQAIATRRVSVVLKNIPVSKAIETITKAAGLSYSYNDKTLELSGSKKYTISLPPITSQQIGENEAFQKRDTAFYEEISETIRALGGESIQSTISGRSISFSAEPQSAAEIENYIQELQKKRVRIIYDIWIAEVSTTTEDAQGIRWNELQLSLGALNFDFDGGQSITDGFNIATTFSAGGIELDAIVEFLEEEGNVEVVSNPSVSLISGSSARLDDTTTTPFLAFEPVAPTGTQNDDVPSVTTGVDTRETVTGIILELQADYQAGLVTTQLRLVLSDTQGFVEFEVGDISAQQPRTTERTISTQISTPPGQVVVIGGIARSSSTDDRQAVPLLGKFLPFLFSSEQSRTNQTQLVIALVPRIVRFRNGSNEQ